jgi:hypothetical protein
MVVEILMSKLVKKTLGNIRDNSTMRAINTIINAMLADKNRILDNGGTFKHYSGYNGRIYTYPKGHKPYRVATDYKFHVVFVGTHQEYDRFTSTQMEVYVWSILDDFNPPSDYSSNSEVGFSPRKPSPQK